jgi:hypothetical protein
VVGGGDGARVVDGAGVCDEAGVDD